MKIKSVMFYKLECPFWRHKTNPQIIEDMSDMLRYDMAFVDPADPTIMALPTFQGHLKHGATDARWRSFSIKITLLTDIPDSWTRTAAYWVTAKRDRGLSMADMKLVTLEQTLACKPGEFYKL